MPTESSHKNAEDDPGSRPTLIGLGVTGKPALPIVVPQAVLDKTYGEPDPEVTCEEKDESCTGFKPRNSISCRSDLAFPTSETDRVIAGVTAQRHLVDKCTTGFRTVETDCEYVCDAGYHYENGKVLFPAY